MQGRSLPSSSGSGQATNLHAYIYIYMQATNQPNEKKPDRHWRRGSLHCTTRTLIRSHKQTRAKPIEPNSTAAEPARRRHTTPSRLPHQTQTSNAPWTLPSKGLASKLRRLIRPPRTSSCLTQTTTTAKLTPSRHLTRWHEISGWLPVPLDAACVQEQERARRCRSARERDSMRRRVVRSSPDQFSLEVCASHWGYAVE